MPLSDDVVINDMLFCAKIFSTSNISQKTIRRVQIPYPKMLNGLIRQTSSYFSSTKHLGPHLGSQEPQVLETWNLDQYNISIKEDNRHLFLFGYLFSVYFTD